MNNNYKKPVKIKFCVEPATTTARRFGANPVPCKGGKSTNHDADLTDGQVKRVMREGK